MLQLIVRNQIGRGGREFAQHELNPSAACSRAPRLYKRTLGSSTKRVPANEAFTR